MTAIENDENERIIFASRDVSVGEFRCPSTHPDFRTAGRITRQVVVFPRTPVWIQHVGGRRFLADASVVTLYNPGQEYVRDAVVVDGDQCDWFGVTPEIASDIASEYSGRAADGSEGVWRTAFTWSDAWLYLRQRQILLRLRRGDMEPFEAEQVVIELVAAVIRRAHECAPRVTERPRRAREAHRDLAERTRAELARTATVSTTLSEIAARVGVSPYHLCRVFREQVGTSPHAYRLDLRFRIALERLADPKADLSELAFDLGFASHSHFTAALRRRMNLVPSEARRLLTLPVSRARGRDAGGRIAG